MSSFLFKLNRYPHYNLDSINKRIYNTVKVSESEYLMNKSSLTVQHDSRDSDNLNWNTMSDRLLKANSLKNFNTIKRQGNSTKSSLTRLRPGALTPGGYGVDIKHNSYARYLARKKGMTALKQEKNYVKINPKAIQNNKPKKYGIVSSKDCICVNDKFEIVEYEPHCPNQYDAVAPEPEVDNDADSENNDVPQQLEYNQNNLTVITDVNDQLTTVLINGELNYNDTNSWALTANIISGTVPSKLDIKGISIGNTVTSVKGFENAVNLTSVFFRNDSICEEIGVKAFKNTSIQQILIPKNVSKIESEAFAFTKLNKVSIEFESKLVDLASNSFNGLSNMLVILDNNTLWNLDMGDSSSTFIFGENPQFFGGEFVTIKELFENLVVTSSDKVSIGDKEYIVNSLSFLFKSSNTLGSKNLLSFTYSCNDSNLDFYTNFEHISGQGPPSSELIADNPDLVYTTYTNINDSNPMYLMDAEVSVPTNINYRNISGLRWFKPAFEIPINSNINIGQFTISTSSNGNFQIFYGDETMNEYQQYNLTVEDGIIRKINTLII